MTHDGVHFALTPSRYVDGHCPDYAFEYPADVAPSALTLVAFLRAGLPSDCAVPNSGLPPLAAPLACSVVLPLSASTKFAPPELATEMAAGGALAFVQSWLQPGRPAATAAEEEEEEEDDDDDDEAAAAAAAAEEEEEDEDEDEEEEDDDDEVEEDEQKDDDEEQGPLPAAAAQLLRLGGTPSARPKRIDYAALLQVELPQAVAGRAAVLADSPAWLELRRGHVKPRGRPPGGLSAPLSLPSIPPRPPMDRMRPLKLETEKSAKSARSLKSEPVRIGWLAALRAPPLRPWAKGAAKAPEGLPADDPAEEGAVGAEGPEPEQAAARRARGSSKGAQQARGRTRGGGRGAAAGGAAPIRARRRATPRAQKPR